MYLPPCSAQSPSALLQLFFNMRLTNSDSLQHVTNPPDAQRNFLVVDAKTETSEIERAFQTFTQERKDIAVVLINQHVSSSYTTLCLRDASLT